MKKLEYDNLPFYCSVIVIVLAMVSILLCGCSHNGFLAARGKVFTINEAGLTYVNGVLAYDLSRENTDTELEMDFIKACSNFVPLSTMNAVMQKNAEEIPVPEYTAEEHEFAKQIQASYQQSGDSLKRYLDLLDAKDAEKFEDKLGSDINNFMLPLLPIEQHSGGSSDVGDVSQVCPVGFLNGLTEVANTPGHSWQFVAQGKGSIAHKGMIWSAKVLVATAIDLINAPKTVEKAKAELSKKMGGEKYVCPIPEGTKPRGISKH